MAELRSASKSVRKVSSNIPSTAVVAVKRLKSSATEEIKHQFLEEAILMSRFSHRNIVSVFGLCMGTRPILLCMEYLNGGSLEHFLRQTSTRTLLTEADLLHISLDLAEACGYLETEGFIHRDIDARNCLVHSEQGFPATTKLGDFGLSKDVEFCENNAYTMKDGTIPVYTTAPEGLTSGFFTAKSDVWSFGILLWEIFSWCAVPFKQCVDETNRHVCTLKNYTKVEVEKMVREGRSLMDLVEPCSANFSERIKELMQRCCQFNQNARPGFKEIIVVIKNMLKELAKKQLNPCFPADKFWPAVVSHTEALSGIPGFSVQPLQHNSDNSNYITIELVSYSGNSGV